MLHLTTFCIHANKGPVIIMNQIKFIYTSPFKDSHSHPIHTCFPIINSNAFLKNYYIASEAFAARRKVIG